MPENSSETVALAPAWSIRVANHVGSCSSCGCAKAARHRLLLNGRLIAQLCVDHFAELANLFNFGVRFSFDAAVPDEIRKQFFDRLRAAGWVRRDGATHDSLRQSVVAAAQKWGDIAAAWLAQQADVSIAEVHRLSHGTVYRFTLPTGMDLDWDPNDGWDGPSHAMDAMAAWIAQMRREG